MFTKQPFGGIQDLRLGIVWFHTPVQNTLLK